MKITEQNILRLTIEYPDTGKQDRVAVLDYLDQRFGERNYRIIRSGPKITIGCTTPPAMEEAVGLMIIDIETPPRG